jgi:hypothetical protein
MDTATCKMNDSEFCIKQCKDRICSKETILKRILLSEDTRKINNLAKVLGAFDLKIKDYL